MQTIIARLDAQMPPLRVEMTQLHNKADKIDADQRKTMVLFEDTDGKFKLVLDAYVSINNKLENIQKTVNLLTARVDMLEIRIDKLEQRINKLEKEVKEGFATILRKLDELAAGPHPSLQPLV